MPHLVYLVEDEPHLNGVLRSYMEKEGWGVRAFLTGEEAMDAMRGGQPSLWVLDIMLPDTDGYQLLRDIKAAAPEVPVIFISARDAELDRVLGLELGGEDYIAKPFSPRELIIRARRLLDRLAVPASGGGAGAVSGPGPEHRGTAIPLPPYLLMPGQRTVTEGGAALELTSLEFDVLAFLASSPGHSFTREQILDAVWGADYYGTDRVVDDVVRRIRKKLPQLRLETLYGYGYRLVRP
ncbi:response regulator transcription factor [Paenibacillus sp. PL2-23]|uniref:response regulator transcription factor n=1 Tax=Paenibacillus sp. PL2-23 TaxID=2100729 RepID=UPI0030F570C4